MRFAVIVQTTGIIDVKAPATAPPTRTTASGDEPEVDEVPDDPERDGEEPVARGGAQSASELRSDEGDAHRAEDGVAHERDQHR